MTREKLAKALGCSPDCIDTATTEKNLLSLDSTAALCVLFPEQSVSVLQLFLAAPEHPTVADRLQRIERELDAIRRESA